MNPSDRPTRFAWPTAAAVLVLTTGSAAAIAAGGLPRLGFAEHADPAALAFAVCGGFALLSLLPIVIMDRRIPAGAAYGFLVGMMIRLIGCAAAVWWGHRMKVGPQFTYWMAGAYLYVLVIELILIGRYVRRIQLPAPSPKTGQSEGQTA